jgi:hypothetical protein
MAFDRRVRSEVIRAWIGNYYSFLLYYVNRKALEQYSESDLPSRE